MPTINVKKDLLMQRLGTNYSDEQFDELCFKFGIELDEITSEKQMALKEKGAAGTGSDDVIYKIDLPANRYDLISMEGLVMALKIFTEKMQPPEFEVKPSGLEFSIDEHADGRPVLMGAVVRNLNFDQNLYNSFADLLDKIHQNIGRKQTVVSVVTQDLDTKSELTTKTRNILIKILATDREKATIALDTIVTMLVSTNNTFQAESISIKHKGLTYTTPDLSYHKEMVLKSYINQGLGINISASEIATLLIRMGLRAKALPDDESIEVFIPPTRHDIIHKCDVMEDVGIAYGYDNIIKTLPKSATISSQVPLNKLSDQLRNEVARCGYTEALNFALCPEAELGSMFRKPCPEEAVRIGNPKTLEFQVARTNLLSGLLKTVASNKKMPLPMKLFEVGDIVLIDTSKDVKARNERHLAALYYGKQTSGFEVIHGLLDRVMQVLEYPYIGDMKNKESQTRGYYIEATSDPMYFPGRGAAVIYNGKPIGTLGILHPEVIANFDLNHPASSLEINIECMSAPQ